MRLRKKIPVFFVESDDTFVKGIQESFIDDESFDIFFFNSGERFVAYITSEIYNKRDFAILFLGFTFNEDEGNAVMNGLEVMELVDRYAPRIDVVMLYDDQSEEELALAKRLGAKHTIKKGNRIILQIKTTVDNLFSKYQYIRRRRSAMMSFWALIYYVSAAILAIIILLIIAPHIFVFY